MTFYFESRTYLRIQFNNIIGDINYHLENQNKKFKILQKATNSSECYKSLVDSINSNINNLQQLQSNLYEIFPEGPKKDKFKLDGELKAKLIDFNKVADQYKETIDNTNTQYDEYMLQYFNNINNSSIESNKNNQLDNDIHNYIENANTLIISETKQKVILPYKATDLEKAIANNSDYKTYQDVIDKEYTIPIFQYRHAFISRFKETYNLMRNIEKYSITDSIDLSLELAFNRLLNPAIITACKSLDTLDIYLDYLDSNETEKFKIFNIKYEVLPRVNYTLKPAND